MKTETKDKLFEAWAYCHEHDKSTEFMLQYMQDFANVDLDCVISFFRKLPMNNVKNGIINRNHDRNI